MHSLSVRVSLHSIAKRERDQAQDPHPLHIVQVEVRMRLYKYLPSP